MPTTDGGIRVAKPLYYYFRAADVDGATTDISYVLGGTRTRALGPTTTAGIAGKRRLGCGRAADSRKRDKADVPITAGGGDRVR